MPMVDSISTLEVLYWSTLFAAIFSAAAGILDVRQKQYDLFGIIMITFCLALGGGTLRDLLLGRPVFWVVDQSYLVFTWAGALATFFIARFINLNHRWFLLPDAVALGLYTVAGTQAALMLDTGWLIAIFMGVITGVAGGILRDILCNQDPVVFNSPWYATASFAGALLLCVLEDIGLHLSIAVSLSAFTTILMRLMALRWNLMLPVYKEKSK